MPRKPVRGRWSVVVPLDGGGCWKCESLPERSFTAAEIAAAMRKYADYIDQYFVHTEPLPSPPEDAT